jgi:hypothetical protein
MPTTSFPAVNTEHPQYKEMKPVWQKMRDFIGGERTVKAKTVDYLPTLNETDTADGYDYRTYLENAVFFNATGLTYQAFMGMIFRKKPMLSVDTHPLFDNVDLEGSNLQTFVRDCTEEVMKVGRVGILKDFPTTKGTETIAELSKGNKRNYLKLYKAESIINWKYETVNGINVPVCVVLREIIEKDPENLFSHDTESQYRVLALVNGRYVQYVYNASFELKSTVRPLSKGKIIREIPFVCMNSRTISLNVEPPPLEDLSNTNGAHYRASASLGACVWMFGRATPVFHIPHTLVNQFKEDGVSFGVTKSIILPTDTQGSKVEASFLEPTKSFEPIINHMDSLEGRMSSQGARMLKQAKEVAESPDSISFDLIGEFATIASIADNASQGLSKAISLLLGTDTRIVLNSDYIGSKIDANTITSLFAAVQGGGMSVGQFQQALIDGEAIVSDKEVTADVEYEMAGKDIKVDPNPTPTPVASTTSPSKAPTSASNPKGDSKVTKPKKDS